jgi:hypothetical protein
MHANVYPDSDGNIWDGARLRLEKCLVPGVELLRLVTYSLKTLDSFVELFEEAYKRCADDSERTELLQALLARLDFPLNTRLLHMYPHLTPSTDVNGQ